MRRRPSPVLSARAPGVPCPRHHGVSRGADTGFPQGLGRWGLWGSGIPAGPGSGDATEI